MLSASCSDSNFLLLDDILLALKSMTNTWHMAGNFRNSREISAVSLPMIARGRLVAVLAGVKVLTMFYLVLHVKEVLAPERKEGALYLACNNKKALFTSTYTDHRLYKLWSCQNVCDAYSFLLDNIYIRFSTKLYRQIVGSPMGTTCAPLVSDLFLFCYEREFITSFFYYNQPDIIEAFYSTSRYLDI